MVQYFSVCMRCGHTTRLTERLALEIEASGKKSVGYCCIHPMRIERVLTVWRSDGEMQTTTSVLA